MTSIRRVSVVIPVYNRVALLSRALASVMAQRYEDLEVIVVDDGSEEPLQPALAAYAGRVVVVRHAGNRGAAAARNTGIEHASGDYVAFLDSDDEWKPGKLGRQIAFMQRLECEVACTGFDMAVAAHTTPRPVVRPYAECINIEDFVWGCYVSPGCTLLARRQLLLDIGGYDINFARLEDWDLLLRLSCAGHRVGYLAASLATVYASGSPSLCSVAKSLERLRCRHLHKLRARDPKLAKNFEAGLAFELAAAHHRDGDYSAMLKNLCRSFALAPRCNRSLGIAVRARLANVLGADIRH